MFNYVLRVLSFVLCALGFLLWVLCFEFYTKSFVFLPDSNGLTNFILVCLWLEQIRFNKTDIINLKKNSYSESLTFALK